MPADVATSRVTGIGAAILAALFAGLIYWSKLTDPCMDRALAFVSSSPEVSAALGPVQDASVRRWVEVADAISVNDQFVPGYRSYDVRAKGSRGHALVTVTTGLKDCSPRIESIDKD